jgi:hypothetical protein
LLAPYAGPNAAPSLERIAILGPALVASAPPPTQPSVPSFTSQGSAWTSAPASGPVAQRVSEPDVKRAVSATTVLVWGALFTLIVVLSIFVVLKLAPRARAVAPISLPSATASAGSSPPPAPSPLPAVLADDPSTAGTGPQPGAPANGANVASVASPPPTAVTSASTPQSPSPRPVQHGAPHGGSRHHGGKPTGDPGTKASAPTPAAGEIPATRE